VRRTWLQRYVFLPTPPNFSVLFLSVRPSHRAAAGTTRRRRQAFAQLCHSFFRHIGK
jgi:hypothetical protein